MTPSTTALGSAQGCSQFIKNWFERTPQIPVPGTAVVLGSGLSHALEKHLVQTHHLPYADIPGFPVTSVPGHAGQLTTGFFHDTHHPHTKIPVVLLRGRVHAYEGFSPHHIVHGLRSLILAGVKRVILTNAAGCLHLPWPIGSLMLISDHINATGLSPLVGSTGFGPQFVSMTDVYSPELQKSFLATAKKCGIPLYQGVYFGVLGPQYETAAEIRMMQTLGASAVGMSTVLESIACKQMGVEIAGLSCLTNYGTGLTPAHLSHDEVTQVGLKASDSFARLLRDWCLEFC